MAVGSIDETIRQHKAGVVFESGAGVLDVSDTTKVLALNVSGITTGTTRTVAFPDANVNLSGIVQDVADPGTGVAIPVTTSAHIAITTAATETNTLAIPTFIGQKMILVCDVYAGGDRVVTSAGAVNQTGNNTLTFGAAADFIVLEAAQVAGALLWRVTHNDGVGLTTV